MKEFFYLELFFKKIYYVYRKYPFNNLSHKFILRNFLLNYTLPAFLKITTSVIKTHVVVFFEIVRNIRIKRSFNIINFRF